MAKWRVLGVSWRASTIDGSVALEAYRAATAPASGPLRNLLSLRNSVMLPTNAAMRLEAGLVLRYLKA